MDGKGARFVLRALDVEPHILLVEDDIYGFDGAGGGDMGGGRGEGG